MSTVSEIECAIEALPPEQFDELGEWFAEKREQVVDAAFEKQSLPASSTRWPSVPCAMRRLEIADLWMNSSTAPEFGEWFARLRPETQTRARKAYRLWRKNHAHLSLRFKRSGDSTILSFFVGTPDRYEGCI